MPKEKLKTIQVGQDWICRCLYALVQQELSTNNVKVWMFVLVKGAGWCFLYLQVGIERHSEFSLARSVPGLTADFPWEQ